MLVERIGGDLEPGEQIARDKAPHLKKWLGAEPKLK
jgi:hypothetical protein